MDPVRAGILAWMAIRDAQRTSRAWVRLLNAYARRPVIKVVGRKRLPGP